MHCIAKSHLEADYVSRHSNHSITVRSFDSVLDTSFPSMQLVYHIAEPQLDACGNQVYNHAWVSWLARAEVAGCKHVKDD